MPGDLPYSPLGYGFFRVFPFSFYKNKIPLNKA